MSATTTLPSATLPGAGPAAQDLPVVQVHLGRVLTAHQATAVLKALDEAADAVEARCRHTPPFTALRQALRGQDHLLCDVLDTQNVTAAQAEVVLDALREALGRLRRALDAPVPGADDEADEARAALQAEAELLGAAVGTLERCFGR